MCDDWIEEEDRAPISLAELNGERNSHSGHQNSWSSNTNTQYGQNTNNQYGQSANNQYGHRETRGRGHNRGRGGRGRGMRRNEGTESRNGLSSSVKSSLTFQISQRDVGKLIGSKGCNILKLKEETRCSIDVGRENVDIRNSVDIHVKGDGEDLVAKCRVAIEKHLGYSSLGNPDSDQDDEPIDWDNLAKDAEIAEKKRWAKSVPLVKNFYVEHPDVKTLSPAQVKEFREENNQIKVYNFNSDSKDPLLSPVGAFYQAFEPYPEIMNTIKYQGFQKPSPVQAQAWPYLLSGKVQINHYWGYVIYMCVKFLTKIHDNQYLY